MTDNLADGIFKRTELLIGKSNLEKLQNSRVIIFGVGGVGSWCAECLIRTGVGHLTIVDADLICETNINRQLMATTKTVGHYKVEVLKERLLDINPNAEIIAKPCIYSQETAESFHLNDFDYVVDAIDSLKHKMNLILEATASNATLVSSMGAALKIDPSRIQVAEFWKVAGCPLGAALRHRMRKNKTLPSKKFKCVFSDEVLDNLGENYELDESKESLMLNIENPSKKARINGTLSHITAIFGFTLASIIIKDIIQQ